jgi:hypothetical protein
MARTARKFADEQALLLKKLDSPKGWQIRYDNAAFTATDLCRKLRGNENLEANQKRELEKLKSALK